MQARVKRVRNPFRFGALAQDDDFADRETELADLTADAMNGQDVVVFAARRTGKSSLVAAVMTELVRQDVLVADIDLWKIPTKEKLAEALANAIYGEIATIRHRAMERALAPFRGLRITPSISIDPNSGEVSFTFSAESSKQDIDATLERLLELPAELAVEQGKSAVLVIDEFQEVVKLDKELPKLMRSVFQRQGDVAHIYLGSKRHLMEQIFNDENEPFWRSAKQMELGPIPTGPFTAFIKGRFDATGKRVNDAVVADVLAITGGHPYATQRLCYEIWQKTERAETAGPDEFSSSFETVLESEDSHFTLVWEEASTAQQLLLQALANEPGRPLRRDYRSRHQLPGASTVQRAMATLTERELVGKRDDGLVGITEPFLAEWIRQNLGITSGVTLDPETASS